MSYQAACLNAARASVKCLVSAQNYLEELQSKSAVLDHNCFFIFLINISQSVDEQLQSAQCEWHANQAHIGQHCDKSDKFKKDQMANANDHY